MGVGISLTSGAFILFLLLMFELYLHAGRQIVRSSRKTVDHEPHRSMHENTEAEIEDLTAIPEDSSPQLSPMMTDRSGRLVRKWIITHTDFDGFTSGALLLRLLEPRAAIHFSSPAQLLKTINDVTSGSIEGDSVHIADLALQPHKEHEFADVLHDLKTRGILVTWIDHHEWPRGLIDRIDTLCHRLIVDPAERTAAAIIRRFLPDNDTYADRLIRFVQNRSSASERDWDRRWRMVMAELSYRRDSELSETVLRIWATDEPGGILLSHLARQGEKREKATHIIATHRHRCEMTAGQRNLLVIDVRSRRLERDTRGRTLYVIGGAQPSLMVGMEACRNQKGDLCLIVWDDFRYSVYRGLDPGIEFTALFGQRELNGAVFRVGGHKYAVSVRVIPGLFSRIQALFRWRLGPETESFIRLLKDYF
ncbi:hypothetical protein JW823_10220 [bacterium]|nr:hypothetical protein [candidate division CSSED10-310 bacterium]